MAHVLCGRTDRQPHTALYFIKLYINAVYKLSTTTTLQLFYASLDFVRDYPGEPVSRYQKGKTKTNLDFLEQETVSGSGISWAICKSAPHPGR